MRCPLQLSVHLEEWVPKIPFRIAGHLWETFQMIVVEVTDGQHHGRGEGLPIFYLNETVGGLMREVESASEEIERGIDREGLLNLLIVSEPITAPLTHFWVGATTIVSSAADCARRTALLRFNMPVRR